VLLKNSLSDISAIHEGASPERSGLEEKIVGHSSTICWEMIRQTFIEPHEISNAVLKAGKALCYAL
jgi:phage major head subunit gpT-like protein